MAGVAHARARKILKSTENFQVRGERAHAPVHGPARRSVPMDALQDDEDPNYPRLPRSPQSPDSNAHANEAPIVISVGRNWNEVRRESLRLLSTRSALLFFWGLSKRLAWHNISQTI